MKDLSSPTGTWKSITKSQFALYSGMLLADLKNCSQFEMREDGILRMVAPVTPACWKESAYSINSTE